MISRRLLFCLAAILCLQRITAIYVDKTGGYKDIVVRISNDVPEDACSSILANIKKLIIEASHVLYEATESRLYFKSATVVIPSAWRDGKCQMVVREANVDTPYRVADIRVDKNKHPIYGEAPFTQQSRVDQRKKEIFGDNLSLRPLGLYVIVLDPNIPYRQFFHIRGCGQPGDVTIIPHRFLAEWNNTWKQWGDPSKLFVHEWAKLRYGIFDERGFPGDTLFPHFFTSSEGKLLPTGTANDIMDGKWMDTESKEECDPRKTADNGKTCIFNPSTNRHIFCSLGNYYHLPSVKTFCNSMTSVGMPMGPTKHNLMCDGRSSGDMINGHPDLQMSTNTYDSVSRHASQQDGTPKLETEISVVRDPTEKYVIILETSSTMDEQGLWKWINKAAQKFIRYDLPMGSHAAVVTFSNTSKVEHSMAQINTDEIRSRLADAIPDKYHLSRSDSKCLLCGVQKSIHDVLRNNMAGAHLVLITRGSVDTLTLNDEKTLSDYIKFYHMKVSSILVPESDRMPLAYYDAIAQMSGGTSHIIKTDTDERQASVKAYVDLMNAFSSLLPLMGQHKPATVIHENLIEVSESYSSTGHFVIDGNLGRDTRFGIYVDDEEDHLIRNVQFTDAKGSLYGPYTSMSSLYDIINLKTVNFPVGDVPPFDDPELLGTQWQYYVDWYEGGRARQKSAVRITSKHRYGDDEIVIKVWTNSDASSDLVSGKKPLAVYAQIIKGTSPVLNADVTLEIKITSKTGNDHNTTMKLYDNGRGDADLVAGDGIYSRFITRYFGAGRYAFIVHVNDNNQATYTIRNSREEALDDGPIFSYRHGSVVNIDSEDYIPTGKFSRSQRGPVVHLVAVPTSNSEDVMPPARVTDLKLEVLTKGSQVLASWTAPGDDFDVGNVDGYRFLITDNISSLIDPTSIKQTLIAFKQPDEAGHSSSFQFSVSQALESTAGFFDKDVYFAILAFDEVNNEGKLSNIVSLYLDSNAYPEIPRNHPVSAHPQDSNENGVLIGALCGSIAALAMCLWASIWYFRKRRVETKSGGVNANLVGGDRESNPNTTQDDEDDESKSRQLTTGSSLGSPQFTTISPIPRPPEDDGTTPVYWSASQLLAYREATDPNHIYPPQLDPIREELVDDVDAEVYAQGLSNYGYHMSHHLGAATSTPQRIRVHSEDNILVSESLLANVSRGIYHHEPIYGGYAPELSVYGTVLGPRSRLPPQVPPKPSMNALLGIGNPNDISQPIYASRSTHNIDLYGTSKRSITHV